MPLLQPAPYLTRIRFQSSTTTASEYPIQDQIPGEAAEHEVHDDILVTRPVQVNLVASRQSTAAQRPSRVGGGGEGHGGVLHAVNQEDGRRESLDGHSVVVFVVAAVVAKQ